MDYSQVVSAVGEAFSDLVLWVRSQQSRLVSALVLLLFGWVLALLLRLLASRLVHALGKIVPTRVLRRGLPHPTLERQVSDVVGLVVFWAVLLFFLAAAADTLGLAILSSSLSGLGFYIPRLLGAIIIAVVGLVLGNLAREAVTAAASATGAPFAAAVGQVVRAAIIVAAALIAIAELGIDITLLTALLSVTLLAVLGAFALAFGLGARTAVSNIIGAHYLRQTFEIGQYVRFGDVEGTISSITSTSVRLRVHDGEVVIPAKQFSETVTMLLTARGAR